MEQEIFAEENMLVFFGDTGTVAGLGNVSRFFAMVKDFKLSSAV